MLLADRRCLLEGGTGGGTREPAGLIVPSAFATGAIGSGEVGDFGDGEVETAGCLLCIVSTGGETTGGSACEKS